VTKRVLLDSGPLGEATHPQGNREFTAWIIRLLASEIEVVIPEIADYELRRTYLHRQKPKSVQRLDGLRSLLTYQPLDTPTMQRAAENWAEARRQGTPTADPKELDCDAILAAQAQAAGAMVATSNVGHLGLFVNARSWRDIAPHNVPAL
jgi:predicted nucleic acid-binding protein